MNRKLLSITKIAILLFSITTLLSACGEDKYYTDYFDSTDIYKEYVTIKANQWTWNEDLTRYEATATLKDFSTDMYDNATIVVSTFWSEGNEYQTSLPYVRSWIDDKTNAKFSETVSYELQANTKNITFYIQNSSMVQRPDAKMDYEFKFSAIRYIN